MEVKVARAGDIIEEAPATNSSATADGAGNAGRANVNGASAEGTAAAIAASEVTVILLSCCMRKQLRLAARRNSLAARVQEEPTGTWTILAGEVK